MPRRPPASGARYYSRVFTIRAEDSPNVRLALAQRRAGKRPTGEMLVEGILPYHDYVDRREHWDEVRQCIGMDAKFWEGAGVLLYPPQWLNHAEHLADLLKSAPRRAEGIGIDPAEGGDETSMCAVDRLGVIDLVSKKTPDTYLATNEIVAFIKSHGLWGQPDKVCIDRGGGGKQMADRTRAQGCAIRTIAFGSPVDFDPRRARRRTEEKATMKEERYAYFNRRAQMYGQLRVLLEMPAEGYSKDEQGFAIPAVYAELRRQLSLIPLLYDEGGRMIMLPKDRPSPKTGDRTLRGLLGCSPDQADSLVLAVHAMLTRVTRPRAGPAVSSHAG